MVIDKLNRDSSVSRVAGGLNRPDEQPLWRDQIRLQAEQLLTTEIGFVDNEAFRTDDHWQTVQRTLEFVEVRNASVFVDEAQGSSVKRICQLLVLDRDEERDLFLSMNLLKYLSNRYRSQIDLDHVDADTIRNVQRFSELSVQIRDHIIQSNVKLVVSIVKTFLKPNLEFDELFSDGIDALMRSVEKFDFQRGFRFSTYATMVIRRHLGRQLQCESRRKQRFAVSSSTAQLTETEGRDENNEFAWMTSPPVSAVIQEMLERLDDRERYIVNQRFGFESNDVKKRTLTSLAVEMGICKERVRQLEQRALKKLRAMSQKNGLDQFDSEVRFSNR